MSTCPSTGPVRAPRRSRRRARSARRWASRSCTALFTTLRSGTESRLSEEIAADPSVAGLVDGVSGSAGALISELAENPATAAIAEAAREALTQGVSVAAWLGVVALVVGLLTTIPLGRRDASTTDTPTEPEAEPLEQG